jgi:hypothetical protein
MIDRRTSEAEDRARRQSDRPAPSIADLLGDLRDDAVTLLKREFALAKLETSENLRQAGLYLAMVIGGALIAFTGSVILLLCLAALMGAPPVAAVALGLGLVGLLAAGGGAGLLYFGGQKLKDQRILPETTIENLKQDMQCIQQAHL